MTENIDRTSNERSFYDRVAERAIIETRYPLALFAVCSLCGKRTDSDSLHRMDPAPRHNKGCPLEMRPVETTDARDAARYRVVRVSKLTGDVLAHELDAACDALIAARSAVEPSPPHPGPSIEKAFTNSPRRVEPSPPHPGPSIEKAFTNSPRRVEPSRDDARDAARYRWLRAQHWTDSEHVVTRTSYLNPGMQIYSGENLDALIDNVPGADKPMSDREQLAGAVIPKKATTTAEHIRRVMGDERPWEREEPSCFHTLVMPESTLTVIDPFKAKCRVCYEFFDLPLDGPQSSEKASDECQHDLLLPNTTISVDPADPFRAWCTVCKHDFRTRAPLKDAAPFGVCVRCKQPITSFHNINGCPSLGRDEADDATEESMRDSER